MADNKHRGSTGRVVGRVFCVFKEGAYRHECGGVFGEQEEATEAAKELMGGECDDYHYYVVVPFIIGVRSPQDEARTCYGGEVMEPAPVVGVYRKNGQIVATTDIGEARSHG